MNEEEKRLDEALRTIREECKKYQRCSLCPLRAQDNTHCMVVRAEGQSPNTWVLKSDEINTDRLFV